MRNAGYVPNLKVPARGKPSSRMWITIVLCVLVPPVGLILLWSRMRCPLRGKLALSIVAVAVMVGMLSIYFEAKQSERFIVPLTNEALLTTVPVAATAAPVPTPVPASETVVDSAAVIPANPLD